MNREATDRKGPGRAGGDILEMLDERMRLIAEEVIRSRERGQEPGAVKVKTAARMLELSEWRVRQLIREGKLKVIHPTPNTVRIPLSEIRRFTEGES